MAPTITSQQLQAYQQQFAQLRQRRASSVPSQQAQPRGSKSLGLSPQDESLLNAYSVSAFGGINAALGVDPMNGFGYGTSAEDVFGPNYEFEYGLVSPTSDMSVSESFMANDPEFTQQTRMMMASGRNGNPDYDVFGTDANGQPIAESNPNDLSPKEIKEIYLKAYADAQARKAMGLG